MVKIQQHPVKAKFGLNDVPDELTIPGYAQHDHPNIPTASPGYVFRKEFVREIRAFLMEPAGDAMCITGPTGSGKTSGVTETAARLNWPVQEVTMHGRFEKSDLVGQFKLVSLNPGDIPSMTFVDGPLTTAMREGHILLINEFDLADPSELAGLNDVIEGRPLVIPENGGEVVKPHPMFRLMVTGNSTGSGDRSGLYQGIMMQNLAFMDRFRMTKVGYSEPKVEEQLLGNAVPKLPETIRKGLVRVANEVRRLFMGESGTGEDGVISLTMSTRTLIRWARLTMQFRGAPNALEYALDQSLLLRANEEERTAIIQLAQDVFGDQWR